MTVLSLDRLYFETGHETVYLAKKTSRSSYFRLRMCPAMAMCDYV